MSATTTASVPTTGRRLRRGTLALVLAAAVIGGGVGVAFAAGNDTAPTEQVRSYGDDGLVAPPSAPMVEEGSDADDSTSSAPASMVEEGSDADDSVTNEVSYGDDMILTPQVIEDTFSVPASMVEEGSDADDSTTGH